MYYLNGGKTTAEEAREILSELATCPSVSKTTEGEGVEGYLPQKGGRVKKIVIFFYPEYVAMLTDEIEK